ncbi:hypothetical protein OAH15_00820 [bacterium]|nr:hypothetical protein [bacterium]
MLFKPIGQAAFAEDTKPTRQRRKKPSSGGRCFFYGNQKNPTGFVIGHDPMGREELHDELYDLMRERGYTGGFYLDLLANGLVVFSDRKPRYFLFSSPVG